MTSALVAVSQRLQTDPEHGERRDALAHDLVAWLGATGLQPVPVPNGLAAVDALAGWLAAISPAAIVLSGGNDLGTAPARDATEAALLDFAAARRLPLLGICRGMQMLACHLGAHLAAAPGHVGVRHRLAAVPGLPKAVNSFHALAVAACPEPLQVLARAAEDGSIEAVAHRSLPWEGWMWHPERERPPAAADAVRLRALLARAAG